MALLRFAPSPTGPLHLGGLRTALFNHLYAKKLGGKWILRIEDTDSTRFVPGSVEDIRKSLEWAGLEYDYGPGIGGPHGPYLQSQRLDLYHFYATRLLQSGHAYRCFCSPEKLIRSKQRLQAIGSSATYDRICLNLTEDEIFRRIRAHEKFVIRLHDTTLSAHVDGMLDLVFGNLKKNFASLATDPILLKSDLFPTYHLASVVDDHEMGITHVLRGEEWLPSLPLHLGLYSILRLTPPKYGHLPLLLNPDGSKMSKRKGNVKVADYIAKNWEPDAVLNWLAVTGCKVEGDREHGEFPADVLNMTELGLKFDIFAVTHRRTILDPGKLIFLNRNHLLRKASSSELLLLAQRAVPILRAAFPESQYIESEYIKRVIGTLKDRLSTLNELPSVAPYFFVEPVWDPSMTGIPRDLHNAILKALSDRLLSLEQTFSHGVARDILAKTKIELDINNKSYMEMVRYALTGFKLGPSMHETMAVLGRDRVLQRLRSALLL